MIKKTLKATLSPILSPLRPGNIVMFHLGRSGSTVLADLLDQHPKIYWGAELYNRTFLQWVKDGKEVVESFTENPVDLLKKDMQLALHRFYGFEMKPFHFKLIDYTPAFYLQMLDKMNYTHYIVLDRRNRMRKIISSIIAHTDKERYHIKSNTSNPRKRVTIDINNVCIDFDSKPLIEYLIDYDKQMNNLIQLLEGRNALYLSYEEHIQNNPEDAYVKTCNFLNIKPRKASISLSKTNPYPLKDMIENFDEVNTYLKGSAYAWMLEE